MPGLLAAFVLGYAAAWITDGVQDPVARNPLLVAVLFGLLLGNVLHTPDKLKPGLDFTIKKLLRLGVILIGFRVTISLVADLGGAPIAVAMLELVTIFILSFWLLRYLLKLPSDFSLLLAAGSAICGAAAVLAVAAITRSHPDKSALSITIVTVFGTLALFAYPFLYLGGYIPGLNDETYGIVVGASIYELAQVYGAGFSVSELAVNTATLIKLTKVLMLIPMVLILQVVWQKRMNAKHTTSITATPASFPWFLIGFVAVMGFNSLITLPSAVKSLIIQFDTFLFIMVMVALGLSTNLKALFRHTGLLRILFASTVILGLSMVVAYGYTRWLVTPVDQIAPHGAGTIETQATTHQLQRELSEGARLFIAIGCAKCHVPTMPVGDKQVVIYSDLLLHDMGPELDDKIVQGQASGFDWRTTPLVGLGLRKRYLHDGRAIHLRDAIAAHGGEARIVRDRFLDLPEKSKQALYVFLNSL